MLGGVLRPGVVGQRGAAQDVFEPVGFDQKRHLAAQAIVNHRWIIGSADHAWPANVGRSIVLLSTRVGRTRS